MRWCSFTMARNEEEYISDMITCVRNQTIPPTRIHVVDDGSSDATGQILDAAADKDMVISHVPSHPSQILEPIFNIRQHKLMYEAAQGADYILCLDADTIIPPDYMARMTSRMESDGVMVAGGVMQGDSYIMPAESGMAINAAWLRSHTRLPELSLGWLGPESVAAGHPTIAYTDIMLHYQRPMGARYSPDMERRRGATYRMAGLPLPFIIIKTIRTCSLQSARGYFSYRGERMPRQFRRWVTRYWIASVQRRRGWWTRMFRRTGVGVFILPDGYSGDQRIGKDYGSAR